MKLERTFWLRRPRERDQREAQLLVRLDLAAGFTRVKEIIVALVARF